MDTEHHDADDSNKPGGAHSVELLNQLDHVIDDLQQGVQVDSDGAADEIPVELETLLPTMQALAEAGREETFDASLSLAPNLAHKRLGDYRILRQIGRGGMGIVYEAKQISLDRRVALKVLALSTALNQVDLARFEREAQAAASLEHPRIVRAYARGQENGVYYLAMQYIPGQDLAKFIQQQSALLWNSQPDSETAEVTSVQETSSTDLTSVDQSQYFHDVAKMGQQAADALQFAHDKGVVHRDIKPSNLLLDIEGDIWIADFGLASLESSNNLTTTGKVIGTLRYSSTEQLKGKRNLDARCDIYSLGITLYELVTLQPAYSGDNAGSLLMSILETEPVRPRKINPNIPVDLESVILKAMSKEPRHRYQTALEFAVDLERFLRNELVLAKRPTIIERGLRWTQRNRLVSLLSFAVMLLVVLGIAGTASHFSNQKEMLVDLDQANSKLTTSLSQEQQLRQTVADEARLANERYYIADMINIASHANTDRYERIPQRLQQHIPKAGQEDLRGFLWHYLQAESDLRATSNTVEVTLDAHQCEVLSLAVAPKIHRLATGDKQGTIYIWDTATWQQKKMLSFAGEVQDLEFSPDEKLLAVCGTDGIIQLYETDSWKLRQSISAHEMTAKGLEFTPDGKTLISCSRDHDIAFWDTTTWKETRRFTAHETVQHISISSDGLWLASGGSDHKTKVWNIVTGEIADEMIENDQTVLATAVSSDGNLVASGGYFGSVHLSDRRTTGRVARIDFHGEQIQSLLFSPDDSKLMVGTSIGLIHLYDISNPHFPRLLERLKIHDSRVRSMEWLGDTGKIVSVSDDSTVRISVLTGIRLGRTYPVDYSHVVKFAPNGESFAIADLGKGFTSWDRTGKLTGATVYANVDKVLHGFIAPNLAFTNTGLLWTAMISHTSAHFSVYSPPGKSKTFVATSRYQFHGIWLSKHSKYAFAFSLDGHAILWSLDAVRGASQIAEFTIPENCNMAEFSPDNRTIAISTPSNGVLLLDWSGSKVRRRFLLTEPLTGLYTVSFSSSGTRVAASGGGTVYLWDVHSGKLKCEIFSQSTVYDIEFSNDDRYLVTAGHDLRLWDVESGTFITQIGPRYEDCSYHAVAFSPQDDSLIAVTDQKPHGLLHIWDVRIPPAK